MRIVSLLLAASLWLAWADGAAACQFDNDCRAPATCMKPEGKVNGVCVGGTQPGNRYDRKPVRDPNDPNRTVGKTCERDLDCGPRSRCFKQGGGFYGKLVDIQWRVYLANKKAVVSECTPETEIDPDLRDAVDGVGYDGLVEACVQLLREEDRRLALEQRGFERISTRDEASILAQALGVAA